MLHRERSVGKDEAVVQGLWSTVILGHGPNSEKPSLTSPLPGREEIKVTFKKFVMSIRCPCQSNASESS